jgi:hypothetical protein
MFSEQADGTVLVTYTAHGAAPKHVGSAPPALVADTFAWAADTSEVGDVLVVGGHAYVRAAAPAPVLGRVLPA